MSDFKIQTPCVGICSTVYGDNVCRGCKRFSHEIIDWNQYANEQKQLVWDRLIALQSKILDQKIKIIDINKLKKYSTQEKLRVNFDFPPSSWVFQVVASSPGKINNLEICGLKVFPEYQHLQIIELSELISEEYYQLSLAHFNISFSRHPLEKLEQV